MGFPASFTLLAGSALLDAVDSIKQGRTSEGYILAFDVELSLDGLHLIFSDGVVRVACENWYS